MWMTFFLLDYEIIEKYDTPKRKKFTDTIWNQAYISNTCYNFCYTLIITISATLKNDAFRWSFWQTIFNRTWNRLDQDKRDESLFPESDTSKPDIRQKNMDGYQKQPCKLLHLFDKVFLSEIELSISIIENKLKNLQK